MFEWPDGFGLAILGAALVLLMSFAPKQWPGRQNKFLNLILFLSFGHFAIYSPTGPTSSGLFRYDQVSLGLVTAFLGFQFLIHIFCSSSNRLKSETGGLLLVFCFLGAVVLVSNNFIFHLLCLPILFLISMVSPKLTNRGPEPSALQAPLNWTILLFVLLVLAAGFIFSGAGTLRLDQLNQTNNQIHYFVGWAICEAILFVMVVFYPIGLLREELRLSRDWFVAGAFRFGASLVFCGSFLRWSALAPPLVSTDVFQAVAILIATLLFLILVFSRSLLFIIQAFVIIPFSLLFWALVKPDLMSLALPILFFMVLGVPRLLRSLIRLQVTGNQSTADLAATLRAASFWNRLEIFVVSLVLMPFGTFLGFNFLMKLPLAASICAASLSFALILVLGRILEANIAEPSRAPNMTEAALGIITLATLIVLGIYPTPLYNYINFLAFSH